MPLAYTARCGLGNAARASRISHISTRLPVTVSQRTCPRFLHVRPAPVRPSAADSVSVSGISGSRRWRWTARVGAEPGIDPSDPDGTAPPSEHAHIASDTPCEICIVDIARERVESHDVTLTLLPGFLAQQPKPEWAAYRWISVTGINWTAVRCVGAAKSLHPLAIEDVLDAMPSTKINWYADHCFLQMNLVRLEEVAAQTRPQEQPQQHAQRQEQWQPHLRRRALNAGWCNVTTEQMSLFLTADNTLVTFFEHSGHDVVQPILARLDSAKTLIRSSADPSMLLHAIVDTVIDLSLPVSSAFADYFARLEHQVLERPNVAQSRSLHLLRSGLSLLMDVTIANRSLVRTLCEHRPTPSTASAPAIAVEISPLAQVYLQDVRDHTTSLANSTDMSIRAADNLSALIFNTIAANQNESVSRLTFVSSFFLPLTFLTSYFGMNFDPMPVVNDHSDAYFWLIATPVMLLTWFLLRVRGSARRAVRPSHVLYRDRGKTD